MNSDNSMPLELILNQDSTLRILGLNEKIPEGFCQIALPYVNTQYVREGLNLTPVELLPQESRTNANLFIFPQHIKVYVEY